MLLKPKPETYRPQSAGGYVLLLFGFAFLLQVVLQQLFVRLLPYLFALSLPQSSVRVVLATASAATGTSALLGVFALLALGLGSLKYVRSLALVFFLLASSFALMDGIRLTVPSNVFTQVYGSAVWLFLSLLSELLVLVISLYLLIRSVRGRAHVSPMSRAGVALSSAAVFVMLFYYFTSVLIARGILPLVGMTGSLVGDVFNAVILAIGTSVVFMGVHQLLRLGGRQKIFPLFLGLAFVLVLWYSLYGSFFSSKILELTWETSFGAPLPAPESLVFGFFAGVFTGASMVLAIARRSTMDALAFLGFVSLFSSLFLASSLTLYLEATVIGLVCYSIPGGGKNFGI